MQHRSLISPVRSKTGVFFFDKKGCSTLDGMDGKSFVKTVEVLVALDSDMTLKRLYSESGITSSVMSQYRTGLVKKAGSAMIDRAAKFFGMTENDFRTYLENHEGQKELPLSSETDTFLKDILVKLLNMPAEKQKKVLELLNTLDAWS